VNVSHLRLRSEKFDDDDDDDGDDDDDDDSAHKMPQKTCHFFLTAILGYL